MAIVEQKPFSWSGLDLGTEPSIAHGSLSKASGLRYLERGTLSTRSGRARYLTSALAHMAVAQPFGGVILFYDNITYTATTSSPSATIPKFVYKSNGGLYLWDTSQAAPQFLSPLPANGTISGQWYRNSVYIAHPNTRPLALRRKPDAEQTIGNPILYALEDMGIRFPTDNAKPVLVLAGGGFINPASDPFTADQVYRVRVGFKDKYGIVSNVSLPSDALTIAAGDTNKTIQIVWNALTYKGAGFSANTPYIKEVQVWLQLSSAGVTSAYVLLPESAGTGKFNPADGAYTGQFVLSTLNGSEDWPVLESEHGYDHGHPPMLRNVIVVSDVAYGLAEPDVVYREIGPAKEHDLTQAPRPGIPNVIDIGWGQALVNGKFQHGTPQMWQQAPHATHRGMNARIDTQRSTKATIFIGKVFSPDYMQFRFNVGDGSESVLAIQPFGSYVAIYTDKTVYMYDPNTGEVRGTLAQVGIGGENSVVPYRGGHAFLSSDSTLAFFDGSTVRNLAEGVVGIFKDEAWDGEYPRFDRSRSSEVVGEFAKDRLYYTIPTIGGGKMLLVIDTTWSSQMYSIDDGSSYSALLLLPQEGRLLGIDTTDSSQAFWYYIEEGLSDEAPGSGASTGIPFDAQTYLIPMASDHTAMARRFAIDLDPGGNDVNVDLTCDDDPALAIRYTFSGLGRREERHYVPARFKGRFLRVRFSGVANGSRVRVYKLRLLAGPRGDL